MGLYGGFSGFIEDLWGLQGIFSVLGSYRGSWGVLKVYIGYIGE